MINSLIFVQFLLHLVFARTLNVERSKTAKQIIAELNDCLDEPLHIYQTKDSKCNNLNTDLIKRELIDSDRNFSECLQSYLQQLNEFKGLKTNDSVKYNQIVMNRNECNHLINDKKSKTARNLMNLMNACLAEPFQISTQNDSKCKNIKHDLVINQLNDKEKQHSKCLQSYLDKLIIFKQSSAIDLSKEKETIHQKEECDREIKAEQSTLVKFLRNTLNECLEEPLSQMNDNDSKCKNINETVVNVLNSVDNQIYSSCLQSYIVNIGETNFGGHYVIWKQKFDTFGWIKISSQPTKSYANLVKNFQNVYLLFLERFKGV